jgi:hypothetical protein
MDEGVEGKIGRTNWRSFQHVDLQVLQAEQGGAQAARVRPVPLVACCPLRGQQARSGDKEGAQRYALSGRRTRFACLENILPR